LRDGDSTSGSSDDTEDDSFSDVKDDGECLVTSLPNVSHFADVLPQIYRFLLQSCLVETNLGFLQHFLLFLTRHYPSDKLCESVIGLSRLIVDRFDIIQKILSPTFPAGEHSSLQGAPSVVLLSSLFEIFHQAMEAAINSQTVPQVTSGSDFLLVTFPSRSQKALVHTALIQAAYLLLSLGPPIGAAVADFSYLKDLWAPSRPQGKPEAQTMEDKTPVSLPPKEVLPYTMLTQNSAVLEASIAAASPSQLCEHVQRFGCPLSCMEKVLGVLDTACMDRGSAAELRHCITDPVMMARMVEVQMLRGSESGQGFLTFVQGLSNLRPVSLKESAKIWQEKKSNIFVCDGLLEASVSAKSVPSQVVPLSQQMGKTHQILSASTEEIEQHLLQIFCQFSSESKKPQNSSQLNVLQDRLEQDLRLLLRGGERSSAANLSGLVSALTKVTSTNKVKVIEGMLQTRFSISLFRLLSHYLSLKKMEQLSEQLKKTVDNICKFLQSSRYKLTKLRYYHSFIVVLKDASRRLKLEEERGQKASRSSPNQKDLKVVRDIRKSQNLLQLEPVITKMSQESIQGRNLVKFEALVKLLVRKSIMANCKDKCITLLQEVKDNVSSSCSPLAYQSHPELFRWKDAGAFSDSDDSTGMDVDGKLPSVAMSQAKVPDISGLLVDMVEVLDSELYAVAGGVTKTFLFGYSEVFRGHLKGEVTNLLLTGQGFLLACLVHNSSWVNLLAALDHVLDRNNFVEWLEVTLCMHMCVQTCICMCTCVCMCMCSYVCVHVFLCVCACVCMGMCLYECVCAGVCACVLCMQEFVFMCCVAKG